MPDAGCCIHNGSGRGRVRDKQRPPEAGRDHGRKTIEQNCGGCGGRFETRVPRETWGDGEECSGDGSARRKWERKKA